MANQLITVSANHDDLTGRLPGEDITMNSGAILTIDSMPHLTPMGILGLLWINDGTLHIDGTRTFEVAYSGGSGTLPAVGTTISWNGGTDTGKVIRLNSGDNVSGVLTLTKAVGAVTPDDADTITDGSWTADLDSVKVGYLIVYGEDQEWNSVDARATLRINGEWYEIGVGTGADGQTLTLPHTGHQPAIWVETGNGTGVFEIWHRVVPTASVIFYNNISQFGSTFESGFVFSQTFGSATVTFGTSTNGGVPPSGARIRIPNVHLGTTTVGAPTTEVNSATLGAHIGVIGLNKNLNVEIDHMNGSSVRVDFRGTNSVVVSDSCWGLWTDASFINKVNATVEFTNVAVVNGSHGVVGGYQPALLLTIIDNLGGVTFTDCVFYAGENANNVGALVTTTMANLEFKGRCKLASNIQDENTTYAIRATTASNVKAETLIVLGGPIALLTGSNNWEIDELIYGLPPGRGTTEQNITNVLLHTASLNCMIHSGRLATGGVKHGTANIFLLTDSDGVTIRNFGSPTEKIDGGGRATALFNLVGITANCKFQRIYYTNLNATQFVTMVNSVADITFENCGGVYNDEIELDGTRILAKGIHGASGTLNTATGVEGDDINCIATIFLDYFKSDDTGAVGLIFQDRGARHLPDVEIVSGTPIWNGLGDLLMRNAGDQIIYTWPYSIRGHTGFQNASLQLSGVNTGNLSYEYDLDTGSGFSGTWQEINGTNLSAETISPTGFGIKVRITCVTGATNNAINGFAILTTTTLAAQEANYYPLDVATVTFTGLPTGTDVVILTAGTDIILEQVDQHPLTSFSWSYEGTPTVDVGFINPGYKVQYLRNLFLGPNNSSIPISLSLDRNYI